MTKRKEQIRTIREGLRKQEKVNEKLIEIYKDIRKMKIGKNYKVVIYKTDKRSKTETGEGKLIYKDKDIFTLQNNNYCESFRVLDIYDGTLEITKER